MRVAGTRYRKASGESTRLHRNRTQELSVNQSSRSEEQEYNERGRRLVVIGR